MEQLLFDRGLSHWIMDLLLTHLYFVVVTYAVQVFGVKQVEQKVQSVQSRLYTRDEQWLGTVLYVCEKRIVGDVWTLAAQSVKLNGLYLYGTFSSLIDYSEHFAVQTTLSH